MGGAVAIRTMARYGDTLPVDGLILVAPAVWGGDFIPPYYRKTTRFLAHLMPWNRATGRSTGIKASDNVAMLQGLGRDPLFIKHTRFDAIYGLVELMNDAHLSADRVKKPTLLLYGYRDQLVPAPAVKAVSEAIPGPLRIGLYPDGYHMLLRDLKGRLVQNDIAAWIASRSNPLPSGYEYDRRKPWPVGTKSAKK